MTSVSPAENDVIAMMNDILANMKTFHAQSAHECTPRTRREMCRLIAIHTARRDALAADAACAREAAPHAHTPVHG